MLSTLIRRIRQNHALEHATIALLSGRQSNAQMVGFSGPLGFTLYTNLSMKEVYPAVQEALERLRRGEAALAYHPNCGTNLLTAALLTVGTTSLVLQGKPSANAQERLDRVLKAILLNALALLLAPRLGMLVQAKLTVDSNIGDLEIASITTDSGSAFRRVYVQTRHP
jgi:hypothetical protein